MLRFLILNPYFNILYVEAKNHKYISQNKSPKALGFIACVTIKHQNKIPGFVVDSLSKHSFTIIKSQM